MHTLYSKYLKLDNQYSKILYFNQISTPIGNMFACANNEGLCLLEFTERKNIDAQFELIKKHFKANIVLGNNRFLKQTQQQLDEYFSAKRHIFSIPLITPSTDFRQRAWQVLQNISYGETYSYKQQAETLKKPKAIRAVASANANNRIAIIIPCHRVIGSDGGLTGYAGGLERKQWLLAFEADNVSLAV